MGFKDNVMNVDYTGKTVIVTGAVGALGASMVEAYAANGANVVIACRKLDKGNELAAKIREECGGIAEAFYLDVTKRDELADVMEAIVAKFGTIDVLVNNAGVNVAPEDRKPIHEFSTERWDWIIQTDLEGVYNCSRAAIPHIIKAGGGNIINIASIVGLVPLRNQIAFTAAKAGVVNMSKAMALELAPNNIRVNVIAPGSIMMEGTKALFYGDPVKAEAMMANIPQHRPGEPEDIAYAALYVGSDAAAKYLTGATITVDGGWTCGFARSY